MFSGFLCVFSVEVTHLLSKNQSIANKVCAEKKFRGFSEKCRRLPLHDSLSYSAVLDWCFPFVNRVFLKTWTYLLKYCFSLLFPSRYWLWFVSEGLIFVLSTENRSLCHCNGSPAVPILFSLLLTKCFCWEQMNRTGETVSRQFVWDISWQHKILPFFRVCCLPIKTCYVLSPVIEGSVPWQT